MAYRNNLIASFDDSDSDDDDEPCSKVKSQKVIHKPWIIDSGCSSHMIGIQEKFVSLEEKRGGTTVFGGGSNGQVIGSGVVNLNDGIEINNVSLVSNLKYNLLSVFQYCDNGKNKVVFYTEKVKVKKLKTTNNMILS